MQNLRPLQVRRVLHDAPVGPIAYPQAKVIVVTAGWTNKCPCGERTHRREPGLESQLPALPAMYVSRMTATPSPARREILRPLRGWESCLHRCCRAAS